MPEETNTKTPTEGVTETTDTQAPTFSPEEFTALQAKYERAQKDLTKFRTRADELAAAKEAAEAERLKAAPLEERLKALESEREKLTKRAQAEAERATRAERLASLAGKVADPKAALKLLDDAHITDDGVNIDALLKDYPFLAPNTRAVAPGPDGAPAGVSARQTTAAALQERLKNARTREERVSLQRQLQQAQKG